jgi:putative MATE family efflux protein
MNNTSNTLIPASTANNQVSAAGADTVLVDATFDQHQLDQAFKPSALPIQETVSDLQLESPVSETAQISNPESVPPEALTGVLVTEAPIFVTFTMPEALIDPVVIDAPPVIPPEVKSISNVELGWTILSLAWPVMVELLLVYFVEFFDTWLSGRFGIEATSAIGSAAYTTWLASLMFSMVGIGGAAMVSRAWGAGNRAEAQRISNQALLCGSVLGLVFAAVAYSLAPWVSVFLQMKGEQAVIATRYLQFDIMSYPFLCISLIGSGLLRGTGSMRIPMFVLGSVSVLNMIFSTVFVYGIGSWKGFGIDGIVMGTILSRFLGAVGIFLTFAWGKAALRLKWSELRFTSDITPRLLNVGIPAALEGVFCWGAHFYFLRIINEIGPVAFASHVVGVQVEGIGVMFANALGQATSTLVGQSLGASDEKRAMRISRVACVLVAVTSVVISTTLYLGASTIFQVMHDDPEVHLMGPPAMKLLAFIELPFCLLMVMTYALRGAGATRLTVVLSIFSLYCLRLPFAWLFGVYWQGGLVGAWIGMGIDIYFRAIVLAIIYRQGKWLKTSV